MDASQYKDYVLVLLFVKYVSDRCGQPGFLLDVPSGGSFSDMVALKKKKNIGEEMDKIISRLAEANELRGVIDVVSFNDDDKLGKGQDMVDRLTNLVSIFDTPALDFRSNRAGGDDLLGDAYEYLMRHFATESGKSKGQFYTPAEVSRIMAKVIGVGHWNVLPSVRPLLFEPGDRPGYSRLRLPAGEIKAAILGHAEFTAFQATVHRLFGTWRALHRPRLLGITKGDDAKALIEALSGSLLATFAEVRLIDPYDVYQHLMDFWATTMQDDVYLIAHAGWSEAARSRPIVEVAGQKGKEQADFEVGRKKFKSDLIPASLLVARYFSAEQAAIDRLESELGTVEQQLDEMKEEHATEGGLLETVTDEKGKISRKAVSARLAEAVREKESMDERKLLQEYTRLLDLAGDLKGRLKAAQDRLEGLIAAKYGHLSDADIQTIVVDDKWLAQISADVQSELERVSQTLTGRTRQLADRYVAPLPQLVGEVEALSARVDGPLRKMGFLR